MHPYSPAYLLPAYVFIYFPSSSCPFWEMETFDTPTAAFPFHQSSSMQGQPREVGLRHSAPNPSGPAFDKTPLLQHCPQVACRMFRGGELV